MALGGGDVGLLDADWHEIDNDDLGECWQCGGERYGIVGTDWDSDDAINGPYDGESERCPCCHGSGLAKDCTYW